MTVLDRRTPQSFFLVQRSRPFKLYPLIFVLNPHVDKKGDFSAIFAIPMRFNQYAQITTLAPSNIKMQTSQQRNSRIWEMREDKYAKSLAKNRSVRYFIWEVFGKAFCPNFKACKETPCRCPFEGNKYGCRKPTETSVIEFSYKFVNSSREEFIKIKLVIFLSKSVLK